VTNPTFGIPSPTLPVSDSKTGLLSSIWYQFFTRLQQLTAERAIAAITVGTSPFVYTPSTIGNIFVSGGTVSSIVLARDTVTLTCPENVFIPVAANDTVTVTYTVKPTMTFVPSARA
jgi:hypothetical protein